MRLVMGVLKRLLRWLGTLFGPGGGTLDPFSGAVAVAEPDDN
jgi:hypothetical protein